MPSAWPWFERKFTFDFPPEKYPDLLERYRGTPARLEDRLRGVDHKRLTTNGGTGWTIKQNVGHLIDLENLWTKRLEQVLAGEKELIAADLTNKRTNEADHNLRPITALLSTFRRTRSTAVARFARVAPEDWAKSGIHPRLKQPMRVVDILYFVCEHDDYHLARIAELLNLHVPRDRDQPRQKSPRPFNAVPAKGKSK